MTLKDLYAGVCALLETHQANTPTKAEVDRIFAAAEAAEAAGKSAPSPEPVADAQPAPPAHEDDPS